MPRNSPLRAHDPRRVRDRRVAIAAPPYSCETQGIQKRLAETYHAHALAGILPARRHYALKRALDIILGVPALLLTLPLYPIIILVIRWESPGPGVFRQVRVGKDGKPFVAYKFRTMRKASLEQARNAHMEIVTKWMAGAPLNTDVESLTSLVGPSATTGIMAGQVAISHDELSASLSDRTGAVAAALHPSSRNQQAVVIATFKYTKDPRITPFGHILRKLSIDELPQLINIVRGEMSLVGPRPSTPYEVERYPERALARLRVLPGLTGQWQVEGRGQVGFHDMVELDLKYATKSSLWRDIALILLTIPAVVKGDGAG
jgi:lipopolysaccharide/colanic/teichoic acid biosynthesis glycosyltransferase